jgi:hypothetical protein
MKALMVERKLDVLIDETAITCFQDAKAATIADCRLLLNDDET